MKHFIQRRFFPVFLCMALALSLTACGTKRVTRQELFPAAREKRILGRVWLPTAEK